MKMSEKTFDGWNTVRFKEKDRIGDKDPGP